MEGLKYDLGFRTLQSRSRKRKKQSLWFRVRVYGLQSDLQQSLLFCFQRRDDFCLDSCRAREERPSVLQHANLISGLASEWFRVRIRAYCRVQELMREKTAPKRLALPEAYTTQMLLREFPKSSRTDSMTDEERWKLYGYVALLIEEGNTEFKTAFGACKSPELQRFALNRNKLQEIMRMLQSKTRLPEICPPFYTHGRPTRASLSHEEYEDLIEWVKWRVSHASGLCVRDVERAVVIMCASRDGALIEDDNITARAQVDSLIGAYTTNSTWRCFKQWVALNRPPSDHIIITRLKPQLNYEIVACNPKCVAASFNEIEELCRETNIIVENELRDPRRLFVCDEKGFSQRSDNIIKGISIRSLGSKAIAPEAATSWEHISVLSFSPLSGDYFEPGVIIPTARMHPVFNQLWPGATILCNPGGSNTADLFCHILEAFARKARETIPQHEAIVLILDSGGGSWLHLSVRMVSISIKYNIRPYFLRPYLTKAICSLDQNPHATMAFMWKAVKVEWGRTGEKTLSLFQAIPMLKKVVQAGLERAIQVAGWRQIGFTANSPINRAKVLEERAPLLFTSLKDSAPNAPLTIGGRALAIVQSILPGKTKCTFCNVTIHVVHKYCINCGKENREYCSDAAALHVEGRRKGWHAQEEMGPASEAIADVEAPELAGVGDLLSSLRQRNFKRKTAPEEPAVSSSKPVLNAESEPQSFAPLTASDHGRNSSVPKAGDPSTKKQTKSPRKVP